MTLLSILLALALEYFFGALDRVRNFSWFDAYTSWLDRHCGVKRAWNGPLGVLLTLTMPLLALHLLALLLMQSSAALVFLLATAVFIYALGPDLNNLLDQYITALHGGDEVSASHLEEALRVPGVAGEDAGERIIRSILVRSHEYLFGVIFWYAVLGMLGALLFALTGRLERNLRGVQSGHAEAVRKLHGILSWPSARLLSLGFALAGNLVSSLGGWNSTPAPGRDSNEDLVGACGLGALDYAPDAHEPEASKLADWVQETQALVNRTLIIWLAALGFMTLGDWLA